MQDSFPIRKVDHIRHYVGNARQSAYYYQHVFGFNIMGYNGLETGQRDKVDYVLAQDQLRLVFTAAIVPDHPLSKLVAKHGDFVQDIAFEVDDVDWSYKTAISRGAESAYEPVTLEDDDGKVRTAGIKTYGRTIHTMLN
ncbi:MAG: VOC family protein, partial [Fimbriimonas ginsengisoli]|nr:VOC family protein [Fimbriimonas ginsengisoli]